MNSTNVISYTYIMAVEQTPHCQGILEDAGRRHTRIVFMLLSNSRSVTVENARHSVNVRDCCNQDLVMLRFSEAGEQGMHDFHSLL